MDSNHQPFPYEGTARAIAPHRQSINTIKASAGNRTLTECLEGTRTGRYTTLAQTTQTTLRGNRTPILWLTTRHINLYKTGPHLQCVLPVIQQAPGGNRTPTRELQARCAPTTPPGQSENHPHKQTGTVGLEPTLFHINSVAPSPGRLDANKSNISPNLNPSGVNRTPVSRAQGVGLATIRHSGKQPISFLHDGSGRNRTPFDVVLETTALPFCNTPRESKRATGNRTPILDMKDPYPDH